MFLILLNFLATSKYCCTLLLCIYIFHTEVLLDRILNCILSLKQQFFPIYYDCHARNLLFNNIWCFYTYDLPMFHFTFEFNSTMQIVTSFERKSAINIYPFQESFCRRIMNNSAGMENEELIFTDLSNFSFWSKNVYSNLYGYIVMASFYA